MSIVFACASCSSPSIALPVVLDDEATVHCGRCGGVVGRWGPFKALARRPEHASAAAGAARAPESPPAAEPWGNPAVIRSP